MGSKFSLRRKDHRSTLTEANSTVKRGLSVKELKNEHYSIIWLDKHANENRLDSLRTRTLLKQINNDNCEFFDDSEEFLNRMEIMNRHKLKSLIIVSGHFSKFILFKTKPSSVIGPTTSLLKLELSMEEKLPSVIIFCNDYSKYTSLVATNKWCNVVDVCTDHQTLKYCILRELPSLKFNLFPTQKLMSTRALPAAQGTVDDNVYFSYALFVDLLKETRRSTKKGKDKEIMINKCRDYYRRDQVELKKIEEFCQTYTSSNAIGWYIRDCFVYRLLNRTFRTEDIALWYLFSFFVTDLSTQIEKVHKQQNIKERLILYRGQSHMPTEELQKIKQNIGKIIATNGFFSTSKSESIALQFVMGKQNTEDFKVVLYELEVDPQKFTNVVFADLYMYCENTELEVLFTIGTVFEIRDVTDETMRWQDNEIHLTRIKIAATDKETIYAEQQAVILGNILKSGNVDLQYGRLLIDMNQYEKAESYFQMMLHVLTKTHPNVTFIYDHLGDLYMRITNWNEALKNLNLAYRIKKKSFPLNHPMFGLTLNGLANYYKAIGNYVKAFVFYRKMLKCCWNDKLNRAITMLNIATLIFKNQYRNALNLCQKAYDMLEEIVPSHLSIEIVQYYGIMGDIHFNHQNYVEAEKWYNEAFDRSSETLLIGDRHRLNCALALADLYRAQGNIAKAMSFCNNQLSLYDAHLSENHPSLAPLLMKIGDLYTPDVYDQRLQMYRRALYILDKNVHLNYAATAHCYVMLANYYIEHKTEYEKAAEHYKWALEIQQKIYPPNHSIIKKTEELIIETEKLLAAPTTNDTINT